LWFLKILFEQQAQFINGVARANLNQYDV